MDWKMDCNKITSSKSMKIAGLLKGLNKRNEYKNGINEVKL